MLKGFNIKRNRIKNLWNIVSRKENQISSFSKVIYNYFYPLTRLSISPVDVVIVKHFFMLLIFNNIFQVKNIKSLLETPHHHHHVIQNLKILFKNLNRKDTLYYRILNREF